MTKETVNKSEKNMYRYGLQEKLCNLYEQSRQGKQFRHLMKLIVSEENVVLAYRNICKNKGSFTAGVDGKIITDIQKYPIEKVVEKVRNKLQFYQPKQVRRVYIDKGNGKQRPLGIPSIWDRLIQQCVLQVLEPICEAKFHERSNGFRPYRSAQNAIAQCYKMIQLQNLHYVVDVDIKGFFDNINHAKLIRQIWAMGIQDLKVLAIIRAMLKADILFNDIVTSPETGTPQGGILSPLLSNIVLNELDWWVASQWEMMPTRVGREYSKTDKKGNVVIDRSQKWTMLREKSELKEIYIVRYADDFKIFCRDYHTANKTYTAVVKWLKERLSLDISEEKSGITNLKKNYMEFLGLKIRAVPKGKKFAVKSHMTNKAKTRAKKKVAESTKRILNHNDQKSLDKNISLHNSLICGLHNYYKMATHVSADFAEIGYPIQKMLSGANHNSRQCSVEKSGEIRSRFIADNYGKSKQMRWIHDRPIIPVAYVQHEYPKYKRREINKYVLKSEAEYHVPNSISFEIIRYLMENAYKWESIEFADNMLSRYIAQKGNCAVTHKPLRLHNMECHHIKPRQGGRREDNSYRNLVLLCTEAHKLITATRKETIEKYVQMLNLDEKQLAKINKFRKLAGMAEI
ncbi:MAG: group II intron reverse transcriptase/maturase [Oscillospiraceae bacterium]|nr:group II intron reverse transcriptase/maturase [Oscillospiraceae bacterium]